MKIDWTLPLVGNGSVRLVVNLDGPIDQETAQFLDTIIDQFLTFWRDFRVLDDAPAPAAGEGPQADPSAWVPDQGGGGDGTNYRH